MRMDETPVPGFSADLIAVGGPYGGSHRAWTPGPRLTLEPGRIGLTLFYPRPSPAEVASVQVGLTAFAWVPAPHAGLLCFRLGALPWSDAPYEAHKSGPGWAESVRPGLHHVAVITLVDADQGTVRALRPLTWPPQFTAAIRDSAKAQLATPRDDDAAASEIQALWAAGDPGYLVATRATATCTGGQRTPRPGGPPGSPAARMTRK
jgi:hypothetical protein